jgi:transposase
VSKTFRPYKPDQMLLMPASLREWLPPDHLAYFISDVVDALDLSAISGRYEGEEGGYPPYHPRMMVKVLLYAYCIGVPSSGRIEKRLEEDIAFRVLAADNTPDFRTISGFRKEHLEALAGLFLQVLKLCQKAGLVKLGHVSLDGTKVKANASKHKAMSYGRMKEEEARLESEVMELLRKAQEVDEEEDQSYGKGKRGDELPKELAFKESRLRKIREAKAALEAEAREEARRAETEGKGLPGVPEEKAQRNFTDPDSRIMPAPGGKEFLQAYNAQVAVDSQHQVIVAAEVTNEPVDRGQALAMVKEVKGNTGSHPEEVSADAGFFSTRAVIGLKALGVEPFIPPGKTKHTVHLPPAPRGRVPKALSVVERMRRKLRTRRGKKRYALRMETVEPVLGQIKQGRGFRQFLLRGLSKVRGEWRLICAGHNLLKLFAALWQRRLLRQGVAAEGIAP